jgi:hypothetical protein
MTKYELYKVNPETGELPELPTLTTLNEQELKECLERMYPHCQFHTDADLITMTSNTDPSVHETFVLHKREIIR